MKNSVTFLAIGLMAGLLVMGFANGDNQESKKKYLTMRVSEFGTSKHGSIVICYPSGALEKTEISLFKKDHLSFKAINQ